MTPLALTPGAPAGSYALSGFDNINLFNGHLNFHLPLLTVNGRGGARSQLTLAIERMWRVERNSGYTGQTFFDSQYPVADWWTGLKPGYGPGVLQGRVTILQVAECTSSPGTTYPAMMVARLYFTAPDGSQYELRDTIYDGRPISYPPCTGIGNSRGRVFVTNDGTSTTFISDADIRDDAWNTALNDNLFFPSGYLLMKDGIRFRIDGGYVTSIRDRNGNQLTFTYDNNGSQPHQYNRVIAINDSLGRQVTIQYDVQEGGVYGVCDRITYKGFGGVTRIMRVSKTTSAAPSGVRISRSKLRNNCFLNSTVVTPATSTRRWSPPSGSRTTGPTNFTITATVNSRRWNCRPGGPMHTTTPTGSMAMCRAA